MPIEPIHVGPVDAAAGAAFYVRPVRRIDLRHDGIGPVAKFFVRKGVVKADDGKRRVREKLGGPIGADSGTKLPRLQRAVGDPRIATLPFSLGIPDETIRAPIEDVIGDGDFADDVRPIRPVITKYQ